MSTQFTQIQLILRNAVHHAKQVMKLTEEHYQSIMNLITILSHKPYLRLGIGEDVQDRTANVQLLDGALTVDASNAIAGVVTFHKATFAQELDLNEVILQGDGVSFQIVKEYKENHSTSTRTFEEEQLPLRSNNFKLVVSIQPGGHLRKAVLLFEVAG